MISVQEKFLAGIRGGALSSLRRHILSSHSRAASSHSLGTSCL